MKSSADSRREGRTWLFLRQMLSFRFKLVALKMVQASKDHLEKHCMSLLYERELIVF